MAVPRVGRNRASHLARRNLNDADLNDADLNFHPATFSLAGGFHGTPRQLRPRPRRPLHASGGPADSRRVKEKGEGGRVGRESFLDAFNKKMQKQTQAPRPPLIGGALRHGGNVIEFGLANDSGLEAAGAAKVIKESRELMVAGKFREALARLADGLRQHPGDHTIVFLQAACHNELGEAERALRALVPLRNDPTVKKRQQREINELRQELRGKLEGLLFPEFLTFLKSNQLRQAVTRLEDLAGLEPQLGMLHYLLAGTLMMLDDLERAYAVVQRGMASCEGDDKELVAELHGGVVRRLARERLKPALALFKQGKYAHARAAVLKLDVTVRETQLGKTFDAWLKQLDAKKANPASLAPTGTAGDVDDLYFFVVSDELRAGNEAAKAERHDRAEAQYSAAAAIVPRFPFINYLYGSCLLHRLFLSLGSQSPPELDDTQRRLVRIRDLLKLGVADAEIEDAPQILATAEQLLAQIQAASIVRALNDRLSHKMEEIKRSGGIQPWERDGLATFLRTLKTDAVAARRQVSSIEGRKALDDLATFVGSLLDQLK